MTFQLIFQEIKHFNFLLTYSHYTVKEGVHLTLPTHIFSVQIKSGAYYITGEWGRAQNKIKET